MTTTLDAPMRSLASGLIALAALATSVPVAAQLAGTQYVSSQVSQSDTGIGQTTIDESYDQLGSTSSAATWTRADGLGSGTASSGMTIGPGRLGASLSLSYQGLVDSTAYANGGMFDWLSFSAQGRDLGGQPMRVVYSVIVDQRGAAENSTDHGLFNPGGYDIRGVGDFGEAGGARQLQLVQEGPLTRMVYESTVYNDQLYRLSWQMMAVAYAYNLWPSQVTDHGSATFDVNYYWGGIQSVTDSQGNPLAYSVNAQSGIDFRNSFAPGVPEPSSMVLMAAGGLMLVVVQRRRASRNQGSIAAQRQR